MAIDGAVIGKIVAKTSKMKSVDLGEVIREHDARLQQRNRARDLPIENLPKVALTIPLSNATQKEVLKAWQRDQIVVM